MADATPFLNELAGALDALSTQLVSVLPADNSMMEQWGWNHPALSRTDLVDLIQNSKSLVQRIDGKIVSDSDLGRLQLLPQRVEYVRGNSLPQIAGNAAAAYVAISSLLEGVDLILRKYDIPQIDLKAIEDKTLLPAYLVRELRKIDNGVKKARADAGDLDAKIAEINGAHGIAASLPADMQSLEEARSAYADTTLRLTKADKEMDALLGRAAAILTTLEERERTSAEVMMKLDSAYSAATTMGLGKAFADRANALNLTTGFLAFFLAVALALGGYITYNRVEFVHGLMQDHSIRYGILWINVTFTALSVSAPVWLAWLLTRQIGQRFRLAEDYGYKASVAKAYEGYRREAANIDPEFAKRLFSIALDRLEEAPLRLVEKESPGSPIGEVQGPLDRLMPKRRQRAEATSPPEDEG
ncbi:hypothetical protein [Phenylobacterium sp.]|jgi:hypothetical protein|uniref:hypothetical protein n=1 Tax=Phenylobacterium sp. TaxID=1871053 RepID=UPI0037C9A404